MSIKKNQQESVGGYKLFAGTNKTLKMGFIKRRKKVSTKIKE